MGHEYRPHRVQELLALTGRLQWMESRHENYGVAELMQMAVEGFPADDTVFALCRLLFRPPPGRVLRPPARGLPGCIGETSREDWPLLPVHVFEGIPFSVVQMWSIAGLAEGTTLYLGYCLRNGVWNPEPYPVVSGDEVLAIAGRFIKHGPWRRHLEQWEREFVLSQAEHAAEPLATPDTGRGEN